jgi:hypothetical protein
MDASSEDLLKHINESLGAGDAGPVAPTAEAGFDADGSWPPSPTSAAPEVGSDLDIAIDDESTGGAPRELSVIEFAEGLRGGAVLVRTELLGTFEPGTEAETRLVAWLLAVDRFHDLVGLARGAMTEDALVGLCFQFYEKGLLQLGPA